MQSYWYWSPRTLNDFKVRKPRYTRHHCVGLGWTQWCTSTDLQDCFKTLLGTTNTLVWTNWLLGFVGYDFTPSSNRAFLRGSCGECLGVSNLFQPAVLQAVFRCFSNRSGWIPLNSFGKELELNGNTQGIYKSRIVVAGVFFFLMSCLYWLVLVSCLVVDFNLPVRCSWVVFNRRAVVYAWMC